MTIIKNNQHYHITKHPTNYYVVNITYNNNLANGHYKSIQEFETYFKGCTNV